MMVLFDLELIHIDVITFFLHGDSKEDIYIVQPDGFNIVGQEDIVL